MTQNANISAVSWAVDRVDVFAHNIEMETDPYSNLIDSIV
jgi:hypothetical protein